jgi:hypothetical protein
MVFPKIEFGPLFLIGSLIFFVALITISTLTFSTRQVTKGYALSALDAKHQELVKDSEVVDMKISTVRSLNYIQKTSKYQAMVRPRTIVYINSDTAIAKR